MAELKTTKLMLSVKEVAELLNESEDNVRGWLDQRILTGERTKGASGAIGEFMRTVCVNSCYADPS